MSDNTMPVDWIPRLCKEHSLGLIKYVVFLPLRIREELCAGPRLAIRQSPYYEQYGRGMSLYRDEEGMYWRNWHATRNPDRSLPEGDTVYYALTYYNDHTLAVASQRQLCALMLAYWRRR